MWVQTLLNNHVLANGKGTFIFLSIFFSTIDPMIVCYRKLLGDPAKTEKKKENA